MIRANWLLAATALFALGCHVSNDQLPGSKPNRVRYTLDGRDVEVEEGLTIAVIDETKHLLGPNTHVYLEAGEPSTSPERIIGDKIKINIPIGTSVGEHAVRYKPLPGKADVWVDYRQSVQRQWVAAEGTVALKELGGVGGRLRLTFDELQLINECGETHLLTNGAIDVRLGSEDTFPESEVDDDVGSEWDQLNATAMIENNLILDVDDKHIACPFVDFNPVTLSPDESATGVAANVLELVAACTCATGPNVEDIQSSFGLLGQLPPSGDGAVELGSDQFFLGMLRDSAHTPSDFSDDEIWLPLQDPKLVYHSVTGILDSPLDIELAAPFQFALLDDSGPNPVLDTTDTIHVSSAHAYGFVNLPSP